MSIEIRPATPEDFEDVRQVELAAFETLQAAGGVSGEPMASTEEELQQFLDDDFLIVAVSADERTVGYAGGYIVEGYLYIGEADVHPDFQRQGLGRKLLQTLLEKAKARGLSGATLTTDRFVPFNAPFYQSLGFVMLEAGECPAFLADILKGQTAKSLEPERRVAMRLKF